jgi:hypothetical protein
MFHPSTSCSWWLVTPNTATYDDVDPNLAFQGLRTIKRNLDIERSSFKLNIEIVRPGTFAALQKHLEDTSGIRGRGYFHIVHFDLHGQVGLRKGQSTKAAFLYFASTSHPDKLAPTRARLVGQLLKNHNVRVAVLNSCESAKANRGDEANLAKLLAKEGIKNVLAMSYKTLSSVATRFMHTFYHSLISNGNPFSFAVRDARQDLRIHSTRRARFGLTRSSQDWIVPVVYACGEDLKIQISSLEQTKNERPTFIDISDHVLPHLKLVGRDFDVLRFERVLSTSKIVGLSGTAGAGKTAFTHHLLESWKQSSFIESAIYVDSAALTPSSENPKLSLTRLLLEKLGLSEDVAAGHRLQDANENIYRSSLKQITSCCQVIVFDNLEATYSKLNRMERFGKWPQESRHALLQVMQDLQNQGTDSETPSIILIG